MSPSREHLDLELMREESLRALEGAGVDHDPATGEVLSTRKQVLRRAEQLVTGPRADEYGPPEQSFQRIAESWSWWLRSAGVAPAVELRPSDVAAMLALLKLARASQTPEHADSWVDLAGYAACGAEVAGAKP